MHSSCCQNLCNSNALINQIWNKISQEKKNKEQLIKKKKKQKKKNREKEGKKGKNRKKGRKKNEIQPIERTSAVLKWRLHFNL